jgi:hypothetical protein
MRLIFGLFLISRIVSAADACAMIPSSAISGMLGTTKNKSLVLKGTPPATEGKVCQYVGKDNSATLIWIKFPTPAAAREHLRKTREGLEKQSLATTPEKFDGDDGFSFSNGVLAVKRNIWLRVNVNSTTGKTFIPDLSRQFLLNALKVN